MLQNTLTRARQARQDEGGFTLIELLIVIVILGVLAGIVVFSVRGITDRGEASACKTEVDDRRDRRRGLLRQERHYPTTLADRRPRAPTFLRSAPKYVVQADDDDATGCHHRDRAARR